MSEIPMLAGEVRTIGGSRVVCVPNYLLTRIGMAAGTTGIMLPPDAAEALLRDMRNAGIVDPDARAPRE